MKDLKPLKRCTFPEEPRYYSVKKQKEKRFFMHFVYVWFVYVWEAGQAGITIDKQGNVTIHPGDYNIAVYVANMPISKHSITTTETPANMDIGPSHKKNTLTYAQPPSHDISLVECGPHHLAMNI